MGETSEVTFKSQHAYGEAGCLDFDIPPNADLRYEITMHDFERVWIFNSLPDDKFCLWRAKNTGEGEFE